MAQSTGQSARSTTNKSEATKVESDKTEDKSSIEGASGATDDKRPESGSQPRVQAQRPSHEHASPMAADWAEDASAQPQADRVEMVSRDVNGDPAQSANFRVAVDELDDVPEHVVDAAYNRAGEEMGAKNHDGAPDRDLDARENDRLERLDTERDELRKHNRHSFD